MNVGMNNPMAWISSGSEGLVGGLQGAGQPITSLEGPMGGVSFKSLILQTMTQKLQSGTGMNLMANGNSLSGEEEALIETTDAALLLNLTAGQNPQGQEAAFQELFPFMPMNPNIQYTAEESGAEGTPTPEGENLFPNLAELGLVADDTLAGSQAQTMTALETTLKSSGTSPVAESLPATDKGNEQGSLIKGEALLQETSSNPLSNAEGKTSQPAGIQGEAMKADPTSESLKSVDTKTSAKETAFAEQLAGAHQGNQSHQTAQTNQANLNAAGAEKAEAYSQISQEILSRLDKKGPMEFKMQLEPESLGKIDVNLKFHDGKLIIDILAASGRTQALLASQVDRLIQNMGLQNVQVENVQVNQQASGQHQDEQGNAFFMNGRMDFFQGRGEQGSPHQGRGHNTLSKDTEADSPSYIANEPASYHRLDYIV